MALYHSVALVTGGASGLGLACVVALKNEGIQVAVLDKALCDEATLSLVCDVSSEQAVEVALNHIIERIGIPTICINCAGIAPAKRIVTKEGPQPLAAFKQVIDINLVGTFNVMRVVAAAMMTLPLNAHSQERGVIINTASVAAYEGQIGQMAYSASKGGVVAMTLPAARELASYAIRVNTIAPGIFATPLLMAMPADVIEHLENSLTFPQKLGDPADFASLAFEIIRNRFLNGEVIRLDAALRMQAR